MRSPPPASERGSGAAADAARAAARRLLKFYAPWCGHCKRMAPILDELALEIGRPNVRLGKVDCTVEAALRARWNVTGYPTVILVHREHKWKYSGTRDRAGLADAVARVQRDAIAHADGAAELHDAFGRAGKASFFYAGAAGEAGAAGMFAAAAESLKHVVDFVASDAPDAIAAAAPDHAPPFVAKVEEGEKPLVLSAAALRRMDQKALEHWIWFGRFPLVSLVGGANFVELSKSDCLLALLLVDPCQGAAPSLRPPAPPPPPLSRPHPL